MRERTVQINVTRDDIRRGQPKSFKNCPIARAVKRRLRLGHVSVAGGRVYLYDDGLELLSVEDLPTRAFTFVQTIDSAGRRAVKPFRFKLDVQHAVACG